MGASLWRPEGTMMFSKYVWMRKGLCNEAEKLWGRGRGRGREPMAGMTRSVPEMYHPGWSDHEFLTGQAMRAGHVPGL